MLKKSKDEIPNHIPRRQYNDRRKLNAGLCEEIRKRMALAMDGRTTFALTANRWRFAGWLGESAAR